MTPQIIYKDKNFLAVSKPAGMLTHQASDALEEKQAFYGVSKRHISEEKTLVDWLLKQCPEIKRVGDNLNIRPGIVHRLDKDTSGVILIPRNQNYFDYLKKLFQEHKIKKTYLALVWGNLKPKIGIIKKPISLKIGTIKRTVWSGKLTKDAITEYKVLKSGVFSLVEIMPKTGRTHQIRVHLASIGYPIVGDSLYGTKKNPFNLTRQFLHAQSLEFNTSDGCRIKIEAELPKDLQQIIFTI